MLQHVTTPDGRTHLATTQDDKAVIREMSERLRELDAGGVRETAFKIDFGMRRQQGHRAWRRIKNKMLRDGLLREEVRYFTGRDRVFDLPKAVRRLCRGIPAQDALLLKETAGRHLTVSTATCCKHCARCQSRAHCSRTVCSGRRWAENIIFSR